MPEVAIDDDTTTGRFEHRDGPHRAELAYRIDGDRLVLVHTRVPDELGGRGLGGELVRAAVGKARAEGLAIDPECPFARSWLDKHPDAHRDVVVMSRGGG